VTATREEVEALLEKHDFRYHRVPLPHGLATPGRDRTETADLVFAESVEGKSVLDVGCALGFFCFEAEKRGARRVVGSELKDDRFEHANLLKGVLDSKVELVKRDLLAANPEETFDTVLSLNVIHHLPEPITALQRLSALANERLILEFPTFADAKFRKTTGMRFWRIYDRQPLLGVSTKNAGQTFVFTRKAIRRILRDHCGVTDVSFTASPMEGRTIAFCEKPGA
jgi:2-polyprenyl-3-methyl-5-hydroxy-6-metoxy-1,4-benzoquinol methylase